MKRLALSLVTMAIALTSCYDHPDILRRLPDETAALIPYHLGDSLRFSNGADTVLYVVTNDEIIEWNGQFVPQRLKYEPHVYCYARCVVLTEKNHRDVLHFVISPEQTLFFVGPNRSLDLAHQNPEPRMINGILYDEVYFYESTDSENNINELLYYTLDEGMMAFKQGAYSLTLIP